MVKVDNKPTRSSTPHFLENTFSGQLWLQDMKDNWVSIVESNETTRAKMAQYPIGRFGRMQEVAQTTLFLAVGESSFISGANLPVDGVKTVN